MQAGEFSWQSFTESPQRLLTAVIAVLFAALITSEIIGAIQTLRATPGGDDATAGAVDAGGDHAGRIAAANLFGAAPQSQGSDAGLPQTSLQLVLRGVFTAADPSRGSAIIESGDGTTRIVRTGSAVVDDTLLERVYANRVILARNGLQENLYFPSGEDDIDLAGQIPAAASQAAPVDGALTEDDKRANILRRLEELRARSLERDQG